MNNVSANLKIYFEEPKWICEYFRKTGDEVEICKLFFDFEPVFSEMHAVTWYCVLQRNTFK